MLEWPSNGCWTSLDPKPGLKPGLRPADLTTLTAGATAVYVVYATSTLDLGWLPESAQVVLVHNDASFDRDSIRDRNVLHVDARRNLGFGAAVNLALAYVTTERVVLCSPYVELTAEHWDVLARAEPDDIVTVPLVDADNCVISVTSRYPTATAHLVSGYRLGKRGNAQDASRGARKGTWPLTERWVSGAMLSIDVARLCEIGGFDERYFLDDESVDLARRFAAWYPDARAVVADVVPATRIGAGATAVARGEAERLRVDSAVRYAQEQHGLGWRTCASLLQAKSRRAR